MALWDVTTASAALEFDTVKGTISSCVQVDSTHFLNIWSGVDGDGYTQVFVVDTSTWAVSTAGAKLEYLPGVSNLYGDCLCAIDSTHFLAFAGNQTVGHCKVLVVNTSTWEVTTAGGGWNTAEDVMLSQVKKIDDNHFLIAYKASTAGIAQTFEVNTSTWDITTVGSSVKFESERAYALALSEIDSNHFLIFFQGDAGGDGYVVPLTVNTSTWNVTTAATELEFNPYSYVYGAVSKIDANHFLLVSGSGVSQYAVAQTFAVNTTTWAVTTTSSILEIDAIQNIGVNCVKADTNHFFVTWKEINGDDDFAQVLVVNTSTWAVSTAGASLEYYTAGTLDAEQTNSIVRIDDNHFINFFFGNGDDGFVQVFTAEAPIIGPANVKTINGLAKASVKTVNGLAIASVKSVNGLT